ncbi:MAG: hypothetical protein QXT58_04590 [Archaeoglobaceae archaeon]
MKTIQHEDIPYFVEARKALERASHAIRGFLGVLQLVFKDAQEPVEVTTFIEAWFRSHGELYWQAFHIACHEGVAAELYLKPDPETGQVFLAFKDLCTDEEILWERAEMDQLLYLYLAGCTKPVSVLDRIYQDRYGRSWFEVTINPEQIEGTEDPFKL